MQIASEIIRRDTRGSHTKLEQTFLARKLLSDETSVVQYLEILFRWSLAWREIERCIEESMHSKNIKDLVPLKRSHLADADAEYIAIKFGIDPNTLAQLKPRRKFCLQPPGNEFELAGYLYVARGSALGGQVIARHLCNRLHLEHDAGALFFHPMEAEPLTWHQWQLEFNRRIQSKNDYASALAGAEILFEYLQTCFRGNH